MSRTLAREDAFKLIFEMEITKISADDALDYLYETAENENEMWAQSTVSEENKKYLETVIRGVDKNREILNAKISPLLKGWTIERISKVNLSLLQLAFYEIDFIDDIPLKVSANEAVQLAKKYGGSESGSFINGVLGAYIKSKSVEE